MAAALPTDVLRLLFAPLALRHRLRVAARVCRHWRIAAYLTVTTIEPPLVYTGPLDLYPNLTSCHFTADQVPPKAWLPEQLTRITSLDLGQIHDGHLAAMAKKFRSLKRLDASQLAEAAFAMSFVRANAATLEHVAMPSRIEAHEGPVSEALPALPALRSLSAGAHMRAFAPFLAQLTRLDAVTLPPSELHDPRTLTALRTLRISPWSAVSQPITALPSLTSLELNDSYPTTHPLELLSSLLPLLVCAHLYAWHLTPTSKITLCTQLAHITLSPALQRPNTAMPSLPALTSLTLTKDHSVFDGLTQLTGLTRLKCQSRPAPPYFLKWHLPNLRELTVDRQTLDWITLTLRTFPSLKILRLQEVEQDRTADHAAFEAEVLAADRRAMEVIGLGPARHKQNAAMLTELRRRLCWLVLQFN